MTLFKSSAQSPGVMEKLMAPAMIAVLVILTLATVLVYHYTKLAMESLAHEQTVQAVAFIEREVNRQVRDMSRQTRLLSQEDILSTILGDSRLNQAARAAALRKMADHVQSGVFTRVHILDHTGAIALSTLMNRPDNVNLRDRNFFRLAMTGRSSVETILTSRVSQTPALISSWPVSDSKGDVVGVVCGVLDMRAFSRSILNPVRIGLSGGAYILSADGHKLAEPDWASQDYFTPGDHVRDILTSSFRDGNLTYERDGSLRMCSIRRNAETGWVLVVEADAAEILAPVRRMAGLSGVFSLLALVVIGTSFGILNRTMRRMRNSESDYRTLADLSPVGIVTLDVQECPIYMNQQARKILELEPGTAMPERLNLIDGQDEKPEESAGVLREALVEQKPIVGRLSWHHSESGGRKALFLNVSPLLKSGGQIHGLVATLEDVTERIQALEMLHQSEERFSSLFRMSPDGILLADQEKGVVVDVNEAFTDIFGYSSFEAVGRTIRELKLFPGVSSEKDVEAMLLGEEFVRNAEIKTMSSDGAPVSYSISSQTMMIGERRYRMTVIRDVTERTLAVEQLRQSEERFSRLFRLSPEAIMLIDLESRTIVEVNDAFTMVTGYAASEVTGRTTLEFGLYVDEDVRESLYKRQLKDGHVENFEFEGRRKDGSRFSCSASGQLIELGGRDFILVLMRDVTEFKKMQEMMIQTEKMISVGGIAAGIAHEINNPLGIVLQAAQNLLQRTRADFRKNLEVAEAIGLDMELLQKYMKARKLDVFIQDIQSAAVRASAIIRHMLDFSRRSESRRTVCDLPAIVDKAVSLASSDYDLKKSFDFKRIRINRVVDDDLPSINCTETEIEQVILNILRNAAQALDVSEPPIADPRIDIRLSRQADGVRIEIADNGPGIPMSIQRRIFEPFFTTKPPGVGTGLGLSVSYFIITKGHGGRMSVVSSPGNGAVFTIDLPGSG